MNLRITYWTSWKRPIEVASVVTIFKYIKISVFYIVIVTKFEHFKSITLNLELPQ